ncbi:MAG: fumarylacetoacetate hydrolase family protein [Acidobacteriota bacterium]
MRLYRTRKGCVVEHAGAFSTLPGQAWDGLVNREDLVPFLAATLERGDRTGPVNRDDVLAPIEGQEVWGAGVTYHRSREARMDEARETGGADFYARVYHAVRPEIFFKASAHRVAGTGQAVRIRADSAWSVPEPELAVLVTRDGRIAGYTIGNDMSARDIEGENPLYLPQAKVYDGSCALGPGVLVGSDPLPPATEIALEVRRAGDVIVSSATELGQMRRSIAELVECLTRECSFPAGCYLLTGTGIVPPSDFTLAQEDEIAIRIDPIGVLENVVA